MDKTKKKQTYQKGQVTQAVEEVEKLFTAAPLDKVALAASMQILDKHYLRLEELNDKLVDLLVDAEKDDDLEREQKSMKEYEKRYFFTKTKVENALFTQPGKEQQDNGSAEGKKSCKLPEIGLPTFNGDLKNWLGWWSQFSRIHENKNVHNADKVRYLFDSMEAETEAAKLVNSYLPTAENYETIVQALQEQFGRDDLLLQVYVRELLTLVISNVTNPQKPPLSSQYIKLESHLRSLAALKLDKNLLAIVLFPLVESSLSVDTLKAWQRSNYSKLDGSKLTPPKSRLDLLMEFIKEEVQGEQQILLAQSGFAQSAGEQKKTPHSNKKGKAMKSFRSEEEIPTAAGLLTTAKEREGCLFCEKNHESDRCGKALSLSLDERNKKVDEKRRCRACLKPMSKNHRASNCKTFVKCAVCNGKHYPILCPKTGKVPQETDNDLIDNQSTSASVVAINSNQCTTDVLLNTLVVDAISKDGKTIAIRLVGDPGSQKSYIMENVVRELKCKKVGQEWLQSALFGGSCSKPQTTSKYEVHLLSSNGKRVTINLLGEKKICGDLPKIPYGPWINTLRQKRIHINDMGEGCSQVQVLLGSDYWSKIATGKCEKLACGLLATETIFGWTLSGALPSSSSGALLTVSSLLNATVIDKMWSLEALGIRDPIEVKSQEECDNKALEKFNDSVTKANGIGYCVRLPFESELRPPTNNTVAEKRLKCATRKLQNEKKYREYDAIFKSWEEENFIEEVKYDEDVGHYLPHHPVFKDSATTPVRPVFDASCAVSDHPSLNDTLHKGPNLLEIIPALLTRFRENEIGVSADIRKAFQMVRVHEEDQKYQKFLWWMDESCNKLKVYKHKRVVFGINCSPFLLGAVIDFHLKQYAGDTETVKKLQGSFYVDNCVTSVRSPQEFSAFKQEATIIMKDANMVLRQWADTMKDNSEYSREADDMESLPIIGILGIKWDREKDSLFVDIKTPEVQKVTKKKMLSVVAQIFDPLGFLSPAVLIPKLHIQSTWTKKLSWDEELPKEESESFMSWLQQLHFLGNIQVDRCIMSFRKDS